MTKGTQDFALRIPKEEKKRYDALLVLENERN